MSFIPLSALSSQDLVYKAPQTKSNPQSDSQNKACYPSPEDVLFRKKATFLPEPQEVYVTSSYNEQIPPITTIKDLLKILPTQVQANVKRLDYLEPTPIQQYSIPIAMTQSDILATSQTGSGKSAAFLIPGIIQILNENYKQITRSPEDHKNIKFLKQVGVGRPFILILVPTRELALQNFKCACQLSYKTGILTRVCYGGEGLKEQQLAIQSGTDILIATPGRLKDYIQQKILDFRNLKMLILDEADTMINMGFLPDIREIKQLIVVSKFNYNKEKSIQTLLFSATFPKEVKETANSLLVNPYYVRVGDIHSCAKNVKQIVLKPQDNKKEAFLKFLALQEGGMLVFCNTKSTVAKLTKFLQQEIKNATIKQIPHILSAEFSSFADFKFEPKPLTTSQILSLSGDNTQQERNEAIQNFQEGNLKILVCTDVAQRGIDLPNVSFVLNYEMPGSFEEYQHRIGRTGRAGNTGTAISFVSEFDSKEMLKKLAANLIKTENVLPGWLEKIFLRKRHSK